MSSSTDRRVARLVGRIAEERAARGRPAISHAPRIARTFSVEIVHPPTVQGSEANILSTLVLPDGFITLVSEPGTPVKQGGIDVTRTVTRFWKVEESVQVMTADGPVTGRFTNTKTESRESAVTVKMKAGSSVDYAEIAMRDTGNSGRQPLVEDASKPGPEMTLVDRLFQGFN